MKSKADGHANGKPVQANGFAAANRQSKTTSRPVKDTKTDFSRWRLLDENGRHTWNYLRNDEEIQKWPQSVADKYHLGIPTRLPDLPPATKPSESIDNCLEFYSKLQLPPGNWECEYGGPMFLLPGLVITWYVTESEIPPEYAIEIRRYLFARQHKKDGGWGLHIEGVSSVFGTAMNYTVLRILGADAEDPRMIRARAKLHELGGANVGPHWAKFWLSVLGVAKWEIVNPVPPELWLFPDWVPIAPWRWWIHMRQVFLPMSYIYSKRFVGPATPLTASLRQELYTQPYEDIDFTSHRNSISTSDNYHPKTWVLNLINWILVFIWFPYLRFASIVRKAEDWTWQLIEHEDRNTDYACLGPVNAPMNGLCCFIKEGRESKSFQRHLYHFHDYMWLKDEGMMMNGTNGVQVWDTAFTIQACVEAGVTDSPKWEPMLTKALSYLEDQQIRDEVKDMQRCYRQSRKGAWPFSTKVQGYTVSDCTSEGLKAVLQLQNLHKYPVQISEQRLKDAVDVLLTMAEQIFGGIFLL